MFRDVDKLLLYAIAAIFLGGLFILASASMVIAKETLGSPFSYILRQLLLGGGVGGVLFLATISIPYRIYKKLALPGMIFSFLMLAVLFIPELSYSWGGARRWLVFGPISFQPSEFLKLSFVIYLASWLDARRQEVSSISYGMIPFAIMLSIVGMFLVMQPDLGTLGVITLTAVLLYFLGGGKKSQIITLGLLGLAMLYVLVQAAPYRLSRITVFLNPGVDPQGIGYQITQAFIAIGSGGFFGQGFGKSLQKYNYLPEPMGDSIFAVFAEESGFLGATVLVLIFGFIFWRGIMIAKGAPNNFGRFLAAGISISIMTQAFINMAAISGLLPLTGIPLPFVSYGGTSLAMTLTSVGILLNISRST